MCRKRIIAWFSAFVICFSVIPTVHAEEYISKTSNFWEHLMRRVVVIGNSSEIPFLAAGFRGLASFLEGDVCQYSEDGYHYGNHLVAVGSTPDEYGRCMARAICKFCNKEFNCYSSDLQRSYDAQVQELPASGITSAGQLKIVVPLPYAYVSWPDGSICRSYCNHTDKVGREPPFSVEWDENTHVCEIRPLIGGSLIYDSWVASHYYYETIYPITGYYTYGRSALVGY